MLKKSAIKDKEPQRLNYREDAIVGPEYIDGEYSCKSCIYYMNTSVESLKYKSFNCGKLLVSVQDTDSTTPKLCPFLLKKERKTKLKQINKKCSG